jgi:acetylornithine deacetylase/succinyl-diaminopimelate desuccinylase-like protein
LAAALALLAQQLPAQDGERTPWERLAREVFAELIQFNTTAAFGTSAAAEAMAARLRAAGFATEDVRVLGPHPARANLVLRYRGGGARPPLLLLAHLDVVEALPEDWSFDPFTLREQDGYFYGRGTSDDKDMAAVWVTNLIRYRSEGFVPDRDLILALTADEEGGEHNGVRWLLDRHRELVDAEYALNEGGSGLLRDGRPLLNEIQTSEKVYQSFALEVRNPGGHSSRPTGDNAIYRLAAGLQRLAAHDFPVQLNETTRAFFDRTAQLETGQRAADFLAVTRTPPDPDAVSRLSASPYLNALLRTTCVPTMLRAGHAENALPQTARATVNCRILPGEPAEQVRATLARVLADTAITVAPIGAATPSPPSPLTPAILSAVERVTDELWPGTPVVPTMLTGATDGLYLRNAGIPTYGVSGLFHEVDDVRAHGRDERVGVQAFYDELEFLYRLVQRLAGQETARE